MEDIRAAAYCIVYLTVICSHHCGSLPLFTYSLSACWLWPVRFCLGFCVAYFSLICFWIPVLDWWFC